MWLERSGAPGQEGGTLVCEQPTKRSAGPLRHSGFGPVLELEAREPLFEGPQREARVRRESFERREATLGERALFHDLVSWANVAKLHHLTVALLEPTQREPLGATDIRAIGVDSTSAARIEERAASDGVWSAPREQLVVMVANRLGLDLEHREIVDAARGAALSALESFGMEHVQMARETLHVVMEVFDRGLGQGISLLWRLGEPSKAAIRGRAQRDLQGSQKRAFLAVARFEEKGRDLSGGATVPAARAPPKSSSIGAMGRGKMGAKARCRPSWWVLPVGFAFVGCHRFDGDDARLRIEAELTRPLNDFCCSRGEHRAACEASAEVRCGFAVNGKARVTSFERHGHGEVALVELVIESARGRGRCSAQFVDDGGWKLREMSFRPDER